VLRTYIKKGEGDLLLALDGPLGPFHSPGKFPFVLAMYFKYRIVPISIQIRNMITLANRWDRFTIPLPFTRIRIRLHDPISLSGKDLEEDFASLKEKIRSEMESKGDF